jgi:Tfp pilus assembly protein PilN
MKSRINLATRPIVNQRSFWLAGSALFLAALLLTVYVLTAGVTTWQQRMTTRTQLRELASERVDLRADLSRLADELQDPATQELLDQNGYLNRIIQQKAFSWGTFFHRLAQSLPRRARVLSVSPSMGEDGRVEVELSVGGGSPDDIHAFMKRLEEGPHFTQVVLQSQEMGNSTDDAVTADLSVVYLEAN